MSAMRKKSQTLSAGRSGNLVGRWLENPSFFAGLEIHQIVPLAGDGQLADGEESSRQFRAFLAELSPKDLSCYAGQCLKKMGGKKSRFPDAGFALQDIVNQTGVCIGFSVEAGLYRGVAGQSGHDGIWRMAGDPRALIVEVKTSDAYRAHLDRLAGYRRLLAAEGLVDADSTSFLVVVGREDTGELEDQIRGSRLARDLRMISVDALMRLAKLREDIDSPDAARRVREILFPKEFTKLDELVESLFFTAEDYKRESESDSPEIGAIFGGDVLPSKTSAIRLFQEECMDVVRKRLGLNLVRRERSFYFAANGKAGAWCGVSRFHEDRRMYWFTIYRDHRDAAAAVPNMHFVFGCGSPDNVLLIPKDRFFSLLEEISLHSHKDRGKCWHVKILLRENGRLVVSRKKGRPPVDLTDCLIASGKRDLG